MTIEELIEIAKSLPWPDELFIKDNNNNELDEGSACNKQWREKTENKA